MCGAKERESEEWEEVGKCSIRIKTIIKKTPNIFCGLTSNHKMVQFC